jgi:hypothetical protein
MKMKNVPVLENLFILASLRKLNLSEEKLEEFMVVKKEQRSFVLKNNLDLHINNVFNKNKISANLFVKENLD